jgi:nucleoside-diphosphate-sugar epimerase
MNNKLWHIVDVRDVADALLLLYEKPESSGRYICSSDHICTRDLVNLLKMYPKYNYPEAEFSSKLFLQTFNFFITSKFFYTQTFNFSVTSFQFQPKFQF